MTVPCGGRGLNERHQLRRQDEVPDEVGTEDQIQTVRSQLGVTIYSCNPGFGQRSVSSVSREVAGIVEAG